MSMSVAGAIQQLRAQMPELFLGPRPGRKSMSTLADMDLTHCCTLLSEREGARDVGKLCGKLGCYWIWLPIGGGNLETLRGSDIAGHVVALAQAVRDTERPRLYLHCSAGIHRTGFMVYLLLRLLGREPDAAAAELATLREVTALQVGDERLALADEIATEMLAEEDGS